MVYYSFQRSCKWGILTRLALKQEAVRNLLTLISWAALGKLLLLLYWRWCFAACSNQGYSKTASIKCLREMFPQDNFSAALPARPFLHKHFCIECVLVQLTTYVNKEKDGSMVCQTFSFSLGFVLLGISFSVLAFLYFSIVTCDKCLILSAKTLSWLFFYIQVFSTGKLLFFSLNTLVQ